MIAIRYSRSGSKLSLAVGIPHNKFSRMIAAGVALIRWPS